MKLNKFGIEVRQCCASCTHKDLTLKLKSRYCTKREREVKAGDVCCQWEMNSQLQMAGLPRGRVKRREYLMYLVMVREEEHLAEQLRLHIKVKTVEEIRAEFERQYGTLFLTKTN